MREFYIRPANSNADDGFRMLYYIDTQLPWLASIGSGKQYGLVPFSWKSKGRYKYREMVSQSEEQMGKPLSMDFIYCCIAEIQVDRDERTQPIDEIAGTAGVPSDVGSIRVPVAGMMLDGYAPGHLQSVLPQQDKEDPFLFLSYLNTDGRLRDLSKGAGAALIQHAKEVCKQMGLKRLCTDCYIGNNYKLREFYESHGFEVLGDFVNLQEDWKGSVMQLRL